MSNERVILLMSVVLAAAVLNIVLYNVDYSVCLELSFKSSSWKIYPPSYLPFPIFMCSDAASCCCFVRLARCCLSSCDLYNHSVTSVAFCFSLVLPSPNLYL